MQKWLKKVIKLIKNEYPGKTMYARFTILVDKFLKMASQTQ